MRNIHPKGILGNLMGEGWGCLVVFLNLTDYTSKNMWANTKLFSAFIALQNVNLGTAMHTDSCLAPLLL